MSTWGKKVPGCAFCAHANKDKMKCYPESEDCKENMIWKRKTSIKSVIVIFLRRNLQFE